MRHRLSYSIFGRKRWLYGMVAMVFLLSVQLAYAESASSILSEAHAAYTMGDYERSLQSIEDLFAFSDPDKLQQAEAWKIAALDYFYLGKGKMAKHAFQQLKILSPGFSFSPKRYPTRVIQFFSSDTETNHPVFPQNSPGINKTRQGSLFGSHRRKAGASNPNSGVILNKPLSALKKVTVNPTAIVKNSSGNYLTSPGATVRNTFSCTNNDNLERGCCCLKGSHTYLFPPQYVTNVLARFDTGRGLRCRSLVKLEIDRGHGWETVRTFRAVSGRGNDESAPVDVWVPVNATIQGFRIVDGCVCCIDYSEITLNASRPGGIALVPVVRPNPQDLPGRPWVVNASGQIFQWAGNQWKCVPGHARDIGIGADGSVWIVGARPVKGGYGIYRWKDGGWIQVAGGAVRIDVGPDGRPWIVNASDQIFQWTGTEWMIMPGDAKDVGIGSGGSVWIIGASAEKGGHGIYRWEKGSWRRVSGGAVRIDVGPDGTPCVVNSSGQIFQWMDHQWRMMPGRARDIGIGSDGSIWIIGARAVRGGYGIYRWERMMWKRAPGGAMAISVNPCRIVRPVPGHPDPTGGSVGNDSTPPPDEAR